LKGIVLKKEFLAVLPFFVLITVLIFVYPSLSFTSLPNGLFNATPEVIFLNWTNGYMTNISLGVVLNKGASNVSFIIVNSSSLVGNYSQSCSSYNLLVKNSSMSFNATSNGPISAGSIINMTLVDGGHLTCLPGRYWNNTIAINASNGTSTNVESGNLAVIVDIPISSSNTLSRGVGTFRGSLPGNATTYQSFYFNTSFNSSIFGNATSIAVNLTTTSPQFTQIFLFDDSGNIKAKSINTNTSQYLNYYPLPSSPAMWEIRVYGNSTSAIPYNGFLIYSTLNVTNSADNQPVLNLSYGNMNVSQSNTSNLVLTNQGFLNLPNVALSSNIYRTQFFTGAGGSQNFTFLVGDSSIETRVRVGLHWNGNSNYTLNVYNNSGNLVMTSSNIYTLAKVSNANDNEVYNETTSVTPGYWTAQVLSNSGTDPFNLNISTFENNSQNWISTNYTTTSFNSFLSSAIVQVNLTIPNKTIDGSYQGNLLFTDSNGGQIAIPIYFNVTTPTILVLNATYSPVTMNPFSSGTFRQDENYGESLTKTINFNISNIGSFDQVIDASLNSTNLTMTSNITSITYIPAHSSQIFNVTINYNNSFPANTYFGWIFINATNNTNALSSHPYSGYNLTIELNLTDSIVIKVGQETNPASVPNIAGIGGEIDTQTLNVYYLNGTEITVLGLSNFTSFSLQEGNVSSARIPTSGNLQGLSNAIGSTLYCPSGCSPFSTSVYDLNFSLPANQPGGLYSANVVAVFNRTDGFNFTGRGTSITPIVINNTGLFMSTNTSGVGCSFDQTCSSSTSMNPNATLIAYAKISNYGPKNATATTINYTTTCTGYTVTVGTSQGCGSASGSGITWTLNVPAYTTNCYVSWNLQAGSSAGGAPSCAIAYLMGGGATWFDPSGVNLTITVNNVTSSSNTGNTGDNNNNLPGTSAAVYVSITNYPTIVYVVQNSTNSTTITVKNVNNTLTQDIGLSIRNLTSSWYSISPSLRTAIVPFNSTTFTITFNIPGSAAVADYITNLTASTNYGSKSQLFTLRVLPSDSTKLLINQTYQLALVNYTNLLAQVNQSKSTMNTTQVDADLVAAKTKLDQVQSYINLGDYFSAQQALNAAQSFLTAAETDLKNLNQNPYSGILSLLQANLLYIAVGGIAVAAMFIAYLFWPTKSENPLDSLLKSKTQPKPQTKSQPKTQSEQQSTWDKLKNKWSWENLKNKWKK
jgi:hypothetical protein